MALDNNQFDGHGDIAQFLEKFKEQTFSDTNKSDKAYSPREGTAPAKSSQYERSLEKLEQKIAELEERFEASASQNQVILSELARTREAMERQKDKDAFLEHLSRTIANLKASVENLSRAQQASYREPDVQRSFDSVPSAFKAGEADHAAVYHYSSGSAAFNHPTREDKERIISSLRQKASQLKAVNSALDREIKKVQQEKLEALKKSAEQAKEILSLRDQLTAAEERFKSFNFEGRIISIKQEYQQKVSSLENQLKEISDTCMKQVEEIESLKAENLKLHKAAAEKEEALSRLEAKERELLALKAEMAALQDSHTKDAQKQLAEFSQRLRTLEGQREGLAVELEQAQASLDAVRQEKEMLEKNFKELLAKINNNDAVIEQLKRKIEVLGQQNDELTQHNAVLQTANDTLTREKAELSAHTEQLAREKESLSARTADLTRRNEELSSRTEALAQEKETLSVHSADLTRQNEELISRTEALTQENENLSAQTTHLTREKAELSAHTETLSREKEELSARAENLAREKEELASRAEHLALEKEEIALHAEHLAREKEALDKKTRQLGSEKEALSKNVDDLHSEKAALEREKAALSEQSRELKQRTAKLESETKELAKENQQLRNQSAALLAARLVQEKERSAKEQTLHKAAAQPAAKPQKPLPPAPAKEQPAAPVSAFVDNPAFAAASAPAKQPAKTKVMTEADLPEIKVADPVPQPEPLFDGEDFLEKTDSFIGRMKWSIFREDK